MSGSIAMGGSLACAMVSEYYTGPDRIELHMCNVLLMTVTPRLIWMLLL